MSDSALYLEPFGAVPLGPMPKEAMERVSWMLTNAAENCMVEKGKLDQEALEYIIKGYAFLWLDLCHRNRIIPRKAETRRHVAFLVVLPQFLAKLDELGIHEHFEAGIYAEKAAAMGADAWRKAYVANLQNQVLPIFEPGQGPKLKPI